MSELQTETHKPTVELDDLIREAVKFHAGGLRYEIEKKVAEKFEALARGVEQERMIAMRELEKRIVYHIDENTRQDKKRARWVKSIAVVTTVLLIAFASQSAIMFHQGVLTWSQVHQSVSLMRQKFSALWSKKLSPSQPTLIETSPQSSQASTESKASPTKSKKETTNGLRNPKTDN